MELQTKANSVMSDEKIVDLYWQRDEQAIKETDIKYKKFLLSVAMNIVHDMCDSEECLNDTYIGAWNAIPPARPILLQSFLSTIMRRTAINRFNANKCQKRIASEFTVSLSEIEDFIADDTELVAISDNPTVIIGKPNATIDEYVLENGGYVAESDKQLGAMYIYSNGDIEVQIMYSANGYYAKWVWQD